MESGQFSLASFSSTYVDISIVSFLFQASSHLLLEVKLDHKVGLRGTSFSWEGVTVLGELEFLYNVSEVEDPLTDSELTEDDSDDDEEEDPGPPGLIPADPLTDYEVSEDDSDGEVQVDNFLAGDHGINGDCEYHGLPDRPWTEMEMVATIYGLIFVLPGFLACLVWAC